MMKLKTLFKTEIVSNSSDPRVTAIKFQGDIDSSAINLLSDCINSTVNKNTKYIIAEMSGVNRLCSAALGEFMGVRKRLKQAGGNLVFAALKRDIKNKLTFMGANKIFTLHDDLKSAYAAYEWEFNNKSECVNVSFPSQLKLVPPVRQFVSRIARLKDYSRRDAFRIETIVDEVCNNAIEHGKRGRDHSIKLKFSINKEKVDLNVVNVSDPEKVATLKAILKPGNYSMHSGTDDKRGRGLSLIKMLSNDVSVDFEKNGTGIRVIKIREE